MAESKVDVQAIYQPGASSIEGLPTALEFFYAHPGVMLCPHWHAQVEVNYIIRGHAHYRMKDHDLTLSAGQLCLFWGGQPHQMDEVSSDCVYAGAHLPLVYFFRLRLPQMISERIMKGSTLLSSATGLSDEENFARWFRYVKSRQEEKVQNAVDELLLRLQRIAFEPYRMTVEGEEKPITLDAPHPSTRSLARMCDFIAANFLQEIDSTDIARAADLHPKYAMSLFKKSTGMTLSKYVTLLRLSHAQAMLMDDRINVLQAAMESGFGSISAFNKSFKDIAGTSPSTYRRDIRHIAQALNVATNGKVQ